MTPKKITNLLGGILLIVFITVQSIEAQRLVRRDFDVGFLRIGYPIDSITAILGQPFQTRPEDISHEFLGFDYPGLVVWIDTCDRKVYGFDIYNKSHVTVRGLRVGDASKRITNLYGEPLQTVKEFGWVGPYDYGWRDYSKALIYLAGDYHAIFFTKNEKVVRMLFFVRLYMHPEDYNVGNLKLDEPFDSVSVHLGRPDSIRSDRSGYTGFVYPGFVAWRDDETKTLCAFDIYDSSLVTHRGLRVGDPVSTFERQYGHQHHTTRSDFGRAGPYDYNFHNYDYAIVIEAYFILFVKGTTIVKMLFYVGVYE